MKFETLAHIVNGNINTYQAAETLPTHLEGKLKPWGETPENVRELEIEMVRIQIRYPQINTPELNHMAWCALSFQSGWVYGPKYDPYADPPTNPRLIKWTKMDKKQQRISEIAVRTLEQYRLDVMEEYGIEFNGNGNGKSSFNSLNNTIHMYNGNGN